MEQLTKIVQEISSFMWGWSMIIMLLGTHLYLTIRLRFPQLHILKALRLSVSKDKDAGGDVSQFGALATSLAATIGTGNIIGVATAVALGGPGAVFWCWLTGVLGMSTKYAEGLLAVKYRIKNSSGEMIGGPMYALERGLGLKWLGVLFCIFTALAAFGIGNTVQANSISLLLKEAEIVCTCLPRNNYLLGDPEFALMGDRKILVNTSVGPTFEIDALKKWLGTCKHSYYLCDATGMGVARDALKDIPNVLYTPYISGKSIQSVERLSQKALANIRTFLSEAPQV